jgi:hypothetical protein
MEPSGTLDVAGNITQNGGNLLTTLHNDLGVGPLALGSQTTPDKYNVAVGAIALFANTTGSANTAVGTFAMDDNVSGSGNTAIGYNSLSNNNASNNTAVGPSAALLNSVGNANIGIGWNAGQNLTSGCCNIMIGNDGVAGDNATTRIGNVATRAFIAGIRGRSTGANDAVPVLIDSNGQLGTTSSSRRYKEDIQDMGGASAGLMRLHPVMFRYKKPYADGSKPFDYGLIAEEVADVYPDLVVRGADGNIETVQYQKLTPMLLNELQREHRRGDEQAETIREQSQRIRALEDRLAALERRR